MYADMLYCFGIGTHWKKELIKRREKVSMLHELCIIDKYLETAFMGAMNEFIDKRRDLIPPTFQPLTDKIDSYQRYYRNLNSTSSDELDSRPRAIVSKNTGAVVGFVAIRRYADPNDSDRKRIGDVEIAIRPTQFNLGFEEDIVKVVFAECLEMGLGKPIVTVNPNYTLLCEVLSNYPTEFEGEFEYASVTYKRMVVVLNEEG